MITCRSCAKSLYPAPDAPRKRLCLECVQDRYPRILACLRWWFTLSYGEAQACVRDYMLGYVFSCSAISRNGGTTLSAIRQAIPCRHDARRGKRWPIGPDYPYKTGGDVCRRI